MLLAPFAPASAGQTAPPRAAAAVAPPLWRRRRPRLLAVRRARVCVPRCTGDAPPPLPGATTRSPARSKCSPFLESALLSPGGNEPAADEWKAVPDIWRTAAQKYPDRVALVDPYHNPPSELTYKQLEQQILDFSHGLRAVGVAPDEKLALFADNSCRWLVADQGIMATGAINVVRGTKSSDEELLQIYNHSESIALVVDSPQFFNRLAETFISRINARFIVLLWGDKSSLNSKAVMDIPVYDYNDITELGRENRNALCYSSEQGRQGVFEAITPEDVATLIYTSGTSGTPKSRWQWGPETRVPAGFYPIRGRGWASFHPRGAVAGHIIQPDMFHGFTPVSVVPEPETRQYPAKICTLLEEYNLESDDDHGQASSSLLNHVWLKYAPVCC